MTIGQITHGATFGGSIAAMAGGLIVLAIQGNPASAALSTA
jgi:hypothetical protein